MSNTTYTPAQLELIDKHREINVYDDWHEPIIDDFKAVCNAFGIAVDDVYYSGFCSQGDGASFDTTLFSLADIMQAGSATLRDNAYGDPDKFEGVVEAAYDVYLLVSTPLEAVLLTSPEGREFCENSQLRIHKRGLYMHAHSMQIDCEPDPSLDLVDGYDAFVAVAPTEKQLTVALQAMGDALYKALESEYDYQTSDAQVWEAVSEMEHLAEEVRDAA